MTAAWNIRRANPADLDAMVALLGQLFALEQDFDVDATRQRTGLTLLLGAGPHLALVGERGQGVAGMATAQLVVSTAEGGPALLVEDVVVRPQDQGQGLGRALLEHIADWGRCRGATRMQLLADADNAPAHDFYRTCGFARTRLVCLRRGLYPAPASTPGRDNHG